MEFNDGSQYRVLTNVTAQVVAGRELFAYRVSSARNGQMYVDASFAHHRAVTAGVMKATLLYQFAWADLSPEAQADYFVTTLGMGLQPGEMVCLDMETGGGFTTTKVVDFARRWLAVVEPALQTKAWLYVPSALASPLSAAVTGDRLIWAPRYSGTAQRGSAPTWRHDVHQYTDRGFFPGCAQSGDTSYTALTTEALLARCQGRSDGMTTSYNGWSAGPGWSIAGGQLEALVVAGEPFSPGVRKGDVADVLGYVAEQLHRRVEPVVRADFHQADDWGYSYRANTNNPSQISCHGSATAIDYNATRHPNGRSGTYTAAQKAEILKIDAEVNNTVRCLWGYDEMHHEICAPPAAVAAAAAKIRGGGGGETPPPVTEWEPSVDTAPGTRTVHRGCVGPNDVAFVQRWHGLADDGEFGAATEMKVKETQVRNSIKPDGFVGPNTWRVMGVDAVGRDDAAYGGRVFGPGDRLTAAGWASVLQGDGNFVVYANANAEWATHTYGSNYAVLQHDGNFVVYRQGGLALWASDTGGSGAETLIMQLDGNLVLYRADGRAVWSRSTGRI